MSKCAASETILVGVVHMPMVEEADDFFDALNLFPSEREGSRLDCWPVRLIGTMEALFGEGDVAWFSVEKEGRLPEERWEYFDIFEGDFW